MFAFPRALARLKLAALALAIALPAAAEPLSFGLEPYSLSGAAASAAPLAARAAHVPASTGPVYRRWMSPEIRGAWNAGHRGQNTRIVVVDDFRFGERFSGNLGNGRASRRHGDWTRMQARMVAPRAEIRSIDYSTNNRVFRRSTGLTVVNLSYGIFDAPWRRNVVEQIGPQERSILNIARNGSAVLVKAAGNDGVAMGATRWDQMTDHLSRSLRDSRSTIFVGALDRNGTPGNRARLASYSNRAGYNRAFQNRFLVVGVTENVTELSGTSFAAPIVSGYAAVLGSKFRSATPAQISNQLLNTARTDTIQNYRRNVHGRGEASIRRAIAPSRLR